MLPRRLRRRLRRLRRPRHGFTNAATSALAPATSSVAPGVASPWGLAAVEMVMVMVIEQSAEVEMEAVQRNMGYRIWLNVLEQRPFLLATCLSFYLQYAR